MKIRAEGLRHTWTARDIDERTVLDVERWSVDSGEKVLLRGVSGSGKSTLLNILSGLLPPTSGKVWLDDEPLYALGEAQRDLLRARSIGYVFQTHLLVPTLSAMENVEVPLVFAGERPSSTRRRRALESLAQVELEPFANHRPVQLSTGQRLRVAVARALVNHPRLILADEPTAALDAESGVHVIDFLLHAAVSNASTLIVASHDPALTSRFERVVDLRGGRLSEVLASAADAELLGAAAAVAQAEYRQ